MRLCLSLYLSVLSCLFCACGHQDTSQNDANGDTLALKYAENITIVNYPSYHLVELKNPWKKGETLHRYVLIDSLQAKSRPNLPEGTVVHIPLRRTVVFNTAHANLLEECGCHQAIAGVADLKYMNIPTIQQAAKSGKLSDCGDAMAPDMERIIDLQPDAILLSPFENSGGYGKLEKLGVPLIECADYMETSALGRAEWMRFYGLLYGCDHQTDSLFAQVEENYLDYRKQALSAPLGLSVITERMTGNTWYIAGGKSSVGQLISDAHGSYAWSADKHSGSLPLTFEMVLDKAGNADVWLFNYNGEQPLTKTMLAAEHHGYQQMKAFRENKIWYVNTSRVPYFEEVSFHPDRLLHDYILLLHPGLRLHAPSASQSLRYFTPIIP